MVDLQTVTITIFLTFIVIIVFSVFMWLLYILHDKKNNIDLRVNYWTAGSVQIIRAKGHFLKDDRTHIISNKLKNKHGFERIPFFGNAYIYPTDRTGRIEYPLSFYQGAFAPEEYQPTTEVELKTIEIFDEKDEKSGKLIKKAREVTKRIKQFIIKPIDYDVKRWSIETETDLQAKYSNSGWFEKYGALLLSFTIVMVTGVICILMLVFAYQWGTSFTEAPVWVQELSKNIATRVMPPG